MQPQGLLENEPPLFNIFNLNAHQGLRLLPLRILFHLADHSKYRFGHTIEDTVNAMKTFGFAAKTIHRTISLMIKSRLILVQSRELNEKNYSDYDIAPLENVRNTQSGWGMLKRFSSLNYLEMMMFYSQVDKRRYAKFSKFKAVPFVDILDSLPVLQIFLNELAELDQIETELCFNDISGEVLYDTSYEGVPISLRIYSGIIEALIRIIKAESTQKNIPFKNRMITELRALGLDMQKHLQVFLKVTKTEVRKNYSWYKEYAEITGGSEYSSNQLS